MIKRNYAYLAATLVSIIYGVTFTVAKDVMPKFVLPFGFILLRVAGSAALFWAVSSFGPKEKIEPKDVPRVAAAAFCGVALNMLTFFKGLI
jgi:drug/metabolite transporter (DMT)-like permease